VTESATLAQPGAMTITEASALISDGMAAVDTLIRTSLSSDVALINQLSNYIIASGGKRLRPQLVLLANKAAALMGQTPNNQHPVTVAAIIEFIHTATLLHDDVVDASDLRRGADTANAIWGNEAAVLVGDFLYSRSFEMMIDVQSMEVMSILASTTNRIAEGEVMQLMNVREPDLTEARYIEVIQAKTARLFQAATELGGVLADVSGECRKALADYGMHLGTAFQIADDVLDYQSDSDAIGKNVGDDLAEGKTTLPLIYAMRDGNDKQRQLVSDAIRNADINALDDVLVVINETGALELSMVRASASAVAAIDSLQAITPSPYRDALECIAEYSFSRTL